MFGEFEKGRKENSKSCFRRFFLQARKNVKQYEREPIDHVQSTYSFFVNILSQPEKGLNLY